MNPGHPHEPSPGSVEIEDAGSIGLNEERADKALTLSDFDADIGRGTGSDLPDGTFYASTEELIAGLSELAEHSES